MSLNPIDGVRTQVDGHGVVVLGVLGAASFAASEEGGAGWYFGEARRSFKDNVEVIWLGALTTTEQDSNGQLWLTDNAMPHSVLSHLIMCVRYWTEIAQILRAQCPMAPLGLQTRLWMISLIV